MRVDSGHVGWCDPVRCDEGTAVTNRTINRYDPIPSLGRRSQVTFQSEMPAASDVGALEVPVVQGGDPPEDLGVDAAALASAGFTGARAQTLVVPRVDGVVRVAVGVGPTGSVDNSLVRDAAAEFVAGHPWAHIDIAGTAQLPAPRTWRNKGASGFGTQLLIELATSFTPPARTDES